MARPRTNVSDWGSIGTAKVWRATTAYRLPDGKRKNVEKVVAEKPLTGTTTTKDAAAEAKATALRLAHEAISGKADPAPVRVTALWRAWCYVRGTDGNRRSIQRYANTKAAAETAVREAAKEVSGKAKAAGGVTGDTTLAQLLQDYISAADISEASRDDYRRSIEKHLIPGLGSLMVRECTTGRLDVYLTGIASTRPALAKQLRAILSNSLAIAVRHDVLTTNPVRGTTPVSRTTKAKAKAAKAAEAGQDYVEDEGPRALTKDELAALRKRVHTWMTEETKGRPRNQDMGDLLEVLAGTGLRIGEVLALRWEHDVDLSSNPATVTVSGTVVRTTKDGLHRKPSPKTRAGHRKLSLPGFATDVLLRRRVESGSEFVFPAANGGLREANNVERQWRDARGEEFTWVTPHSFRRTVLTEITEKGTDRAAMMQGGQSKIAVLEDHYIDRAAEAPDNTAILDALGPSA